MPISIYRLQIDIIHVNLADQEDIQEDIREIPEKVTSARCTDYLYVVEYVIFHDIRKLRNVRLISWGTSLNCFNFFIMIYALFLQHGKKR